MPVFLNIHKHTYVLSIQPPMSSKCDKISFKWFPTHIYEAFCKVLAMISLPTDEKQVQPLQVRVDLGVMTMKEYSTLPRAPMQFTLNTPFFVGGGVLSLCRGYSHCILNPADSVVRIQSSSFKTHDKLIELFSICLYFSNKLLLMS